MRMRRILAFVMAMILTCSTFGSASITGYAAPTDGVEVETVSVTEEDTEEDTEESSEEAVEADLDEIESVEESSGEVSDEEATTTESDEELMVEETSEEDVTEEMTTEAVIGNINSMSVAPLSDGTNYTEIGEIVDQGDCQDLWIVEYDITSAGLEVNDETIINILNAYKEAGEVVDQVSISLSGTDDSISMDLWNAAFELMEATEGNKETDFNYCVTDSDSYCSIGWMFDDISSAKADVNISSEFAAKGAGEGWNIQINNTTFAAHGIDINYSMSDGQEGFEEFRDALAIMTDPQSSYGGHLYDMDGNEISGTAVCPTSGDSYYNATVFGIDELEANTPYRVRMPLAYTGSVETWEDGTKELMLQAWKVDMECFSKQNLLDLLDANKGSEFGSIYIERPSSVTTINGEVVNAASALLAKPSNDEEQSVVKFAFNDGDNEKYSEIHLINPSGSEAEADVTATAALDVSGSSPTVTVNIPEFNADRVDVWFGIGKTTAAGTALMGLYGEDERKLEISGTDTWVNYNLDDYNVSFYIGNADNLTDGSVYTFSDYVYKGQVDTWIDNGVEKKALNIFCSEMQEFSRENILAALNARAEEGLKVNEVYLEITQIPSGTLYGGIVDAACALLIEPTEESPSVFTVGFVQEDKKVNWTLYNPTGAAAGYEEAATPIVASCDVADGKVTITKNTTEAAFNAESVNVGFAFANGSNEAKALREIFGTKENILGIGDTGVTAYYYINEYGTWINVNDTAKLDNETQYELSDLTYSGIIEETENGHTLFVEWFGFEEIAEECTTANVVNAIKSHGTEKFDYIEIRLLNEERGKLTIDYTIFNAALAQLNENSRGINYVVDQDGCTTAYEFPSPVKLSKNVVMQYELDINDYGRPYMKFNHPASFGKNAYNMSIQLYTEDELTQRLMERLGDGTDGASYYLYPVEKVEMGLNWEPHYYEESDDIEVMAINLLAVNTLNNNQVYTINPKLIGNINTEVRDLGNDNTREVRILHINSAEYGYETFKEGELEDYIEDWKVAIGSGEEQPFDIVTIEQKSTDKNIIRKNAYNAARELLAGGDYTEINFTFDSSVDEPIEDTDDWNWYQNQVNWSFPNPSEATKDMTVGLTFTPKGEDGLKLKALKNTYPASGVNVGFSVDMDLPMAGLFSETIGDEPDPGEDYRHIGILSNVANLTLANSDAWQGSYINGEGKTVMQFNIDNAQNLPATECTAVPIGWGEEFYIGQEGLNFIPNMVMKPGTKATWKSFDTNIGNFNGNTLTLLNEGTFLYAASFKNTNGVQVAEIYEANVTTKLLDIDFVNTQKTADGENVLTMTMNPEEDKKYFENQDDWYPRAYLDLRFYPDRAGVDPSNWEWSISGDEGVIELLKNHEYEGNYYPDGEIKALKPGTVTITVKCKDGDGYLKDTNGADLSASCTVTVESSVYDEIDWETAFEGIPTVAITNYDKTLADIKLPAEFAWKVPSTSLASFTNTGWYDFPAVYTSSTDGRTAEVMLGVAFISIEGVTLCADIEIATGNEEESTWVELGQGSVVEGGTVLNFWYSINVWNGDFNLEELNGLLAATGKNIELSLEYDKAITMGENGTYFIADAANGGKKTFKISLMELDTSKANAKAKAIKTGSFTVTVAKKAIADFSQMYIGKAINEGYEAFEGMIGEKGTFYFGLPKDSGFKLTVKNLNTAVSKWGTITYKEITPDESEVTYYVACVPYEIVGEGNVAYSLTANDEVKTSVSRTAAVYYRDYLPRMQETKLTIDKNWDDTVAGLPIQMDDDTYFGDSNDSSVSFFTENFDITLVNEDERERVVVSFKEGVDVKKGNYKISLDVPVTTPLDNGQGGKKQITWPLQLTVTVTDKLPTLTVKQTEKVNLFYTDAEGDGAFAISGSAEIESVELKSQKDGEALDYTLEDTGDGTYVVKLKADATGSNKKASIVVSFTGYTKTVEKKVTIGTVNTAPTLVLSSKSDTYYTKYSRGGDLNTYLSFTDKSTGESVNISSVTVAGDTENTELPDNQDDLFSFATKKNKNAYALGKDAFGITLVLEDAENAVKVTDKFTFYVKEANWAQPVKVSYSIKVDTTIPKLELSSKSVTINKNDALYSQQVALTQLNLKGSDRDILTEGYWVSFSGTDAKSNQYFNTELILEQHNDTLRIRLNKNALPKGTYKYNVNLHADELPTLTTQLTVKVVDEAPAKCITVSGKGSIDILDREGTSVTYTATLKNVQGTIVHAELRGTDANMFDSELVDGKLVVKAYDWAGYSTKHAYKVTPVFIVQGEDYGEFELEGKEQSIKVKQGKPKLTLTADVSNILYRKRANEVTIDLEALLNKTTDVKIVGIEPLNYAGTFMYELIDESGDVIEENENSEIKYVEKIRIKENDYPQEIIATGKTVTLQFNVYYEGMAVNEKPIKTTFKMVVK